jgi:hypothetical protein
MWSDAWFVPHGWFHHWHLVDQRFKLGAAAICSRIG